MGDLLIMTAMFMMGNTKIKMLKALDDIYLKVALLSLIFPFFNFC